EEGNQTLFVRCTLVYLEEELNRSVQIIPPPVLAPLNNLTNHTTIKPPGKNLKKMVSDFFHTITSLEVSQLVSAIMHDVLTLDYAGLLSDVASSLVVLLLLFAAWAYAILKTSALYPLIALYVFYRIFGKSLKKFLKKHVKIKLHHKPKFLTRLVKTRFIIIIIGVGLMLHRALRAFDVCVAYPFVRAHEALYYAVHKPEIIERNIYFLIRKVDTFLETKKTYTADELSALTTDYEKLSRQVQSLASLRLPEQEKTFIKLHFSIVTLKIDYITWVVEAQRGRQENMSRIPEGAGGKEPLQKDIAAIESEYASQHTLLQASYVQNLSAAYTALKKLQKEMRRADDKKREQKEEKPLSRQEAQAIIRELYYLLKEAQHFMHTDKSFSGKNVERAEHLYSELTARGRDVVEQSSLEFIASLLKRTEQQVKS
ncbi:hypothetical protein COY95_00810, partial [Candidatus Woesearchaeota archaeon CG_4_10_14_0_8_um_filter_47_5]